MLLPVIISFLVRSVRIAMSNLFLRNLKREYPVISSGKGVWLTDKSNRQYLDGCSGAVVSNIGHAVPEIIEAINTQLSKVEFAHTSQFISEPAAELSERLIKMAPSRFQSSGLVYFVSGGSEAVETALKLARAYFYECGLYQKRIVISRWGSYHGSTQGALSATGHPARRKPYLPVLSDNPHIAASHPYRCACGADVCNSEECGKKLAAELDDAIKKCGAENVMAFIAEPVVGAALGAVVPHPGYFKQIREICNRHNILFIADEVMTGLGRIGQDFGISAFGVEPDIIALGKGLSAGYMPLGAVLASTEVSAIFSRGSGVFEHGFTYSGHPVACAAGLAVLQYMDGHNLLERVRMLEPVLEAMLNSLRDIEIVGDVRGRGFLWGVELVCERQNKKPFAPDLRVSQKLAAEASKLGLLIYPGSGSIDGVKGDHFIVAPPFVITEAELETLGSRLRQAVRKIAQSVPSTSRI